MGADLYLNTTYKRNSKRFEVKFNSAVMHRNAQTDKEKEEELQKEVTKYYELMYSQGYYRDSYNDSNLLWQFGLDYWKTFKKLLNDKGDLEPKAARTVLAMLKRREKTFYDKMVSLDQENRDYFVNKYSQLRGFLCEAIVAERSIECSI